MESILLIISKIGWMNCRKIFSLLDFYLLSLNLIDFHVPFSLWKNSFFLFICFLFTSHNCYWLIGILACFVTKIAFNFKLTLRIYCTKIRFSFSIRLILQMLSLESKPMQGAFTFQFNYSQFSQLQSLHFIVVKP